MVKIDGACRFFLHCYHNIAFLILQELLTTLLQGAALEKSALLRNKEL